ncbi:MAG TPA: hypothetical protein VGH73_08960 [Thermoanaerobaculia bacterium]
MAKIHPRPELLDGPIQLLPEVRGRFLRHLRACPACREALRGPEPGTRPDGNLLSWPAAATEHGRAVDGVLAGFRPRFQAAARERAEAPALFSELLAHGPERREVLARNSRRFRNLPLCGLLLTRGTQDALDAPHQGERLAALALGLVDSLDPAWYGDRVLADARGCCWTVIANARRVAADLPGAEAALQVARTHLGQGTGDRLEKARLLACKACLRRAQGRLAEAAALFRRAVSVFLAAGEPHRAAESIVGLALTEYDSGRPERAVRLLEAATLLLDPGTARQAAG